MAVTETVIGAVFALVLLTALVLRIRAFRSQHDWQFGPHLHDTVHEVLQPYEGQQLPIGELRQLERNAQRVFLDALMGVGLVPDGWRLELTSDELLGPMPHVVGPAGQRLTLAEFEAQLRDHRIRLDAA